MRSRTSVVPGAAAKAAEASKHRVHAHDGTSGYRLVPFVVNSYGRLRSEAIALLNEWATWAASGGFYNQNAYLVWTKVVFRRDPDGDFLGVILRWKRRLVFSALSH
jgi:hypothetical protein